MKTIEFIARKDIAKENKGAAENLFTKENRALNRLLGIHKVNKCKKLDKKNTS